jgi:hypothetical protein
MPHVIKTGKGCCKLFSTKAWHFEAPEGDKVMKCPCCGSEVETGVHPALERLVTCDYPTGRIVQRCLSELIADFGQWVSISRLIHASYFDTKTKKSPSDTINRMLQLNRGSIAVMGLKVEGDIVNGYRVVWLKS